MKHIGRVLVVEDDPDTCENLCDILELDNLAVVTAGSVAELSYLIGDDKIGTAAVIDPRPDVEIYVELARKRHVPITHVFETHI